MASTLDRTLDAPEPAGPAPSSSVRLVMRAPQTTHEVERLLRRRLALVALLAALTSAFFSAFRYSTPDQWAYFRSLSSGTSLLIFEGLFCVLGLVLAVALWRRTTWSLRALRTVEYTILSLFALYIGWTQAIAWSGTRITAEADGGYDPFVLRQFVDSMALRWLALIVGMATLIPETWRRSAVMVTCGAFVAMLITGWMAFTDPVYSLQPGRTLFLMGFWMVVAVTIAIFGSYKLAELREQVREALELGQYRLKRKLGSGGMGDVYLAEHVMLKQECAIKLIRPERAGDAQALKRFEREVQSTSRLKHWNTVQIFDYGLADDGTFYYVMEYLPGLTLEEMVRRDGPMPPARAIYFLRQMCAALNEAHGIGLIHRDIKPANIIACARAGVHDLAKLLDFGLVRDTRLAAGSDALTLDGAFAGTPAYVSPEQIDGRAPLDGRTDIYGLGGVAYFLVTGEPPFVRGRPLEILFAHVHEPVRPPSQMRPDLPADLESAILRCLAKEPAGRFATVADLDAALAACRAGGGWDEAAAAAWWERAGSREGQARDAPA